MPRISANWSPRRANWRSRSKSGKIVDALDQVTVAFGPYYQIGQTMAKAYVADGPTAGNKMMSEFDERCEALSATMETLIALSQSLSKQGQEEIGATTAHAISQLETLSDVLVGDRDSVAGAGGRGIHPHSFQRQQSAARNGRDHACVGERKTDVSIPALPDMTRSAHEPRGRGVQRQRHSDACPGGRAEGGGGGAECPAAQDRDDATGRYVRECGRSDHSDIRIRNQRTARISAKLLQANADTTQRLSSVVAATSQDASTNVQTVAAAAMALKSEVGEIGRQVEESTRITNEAVSQAGQVASISKCCRSRPPRSTRWSA